MFRNALEPWHLLILGLVIVLLFGSKKLPDTARALGKSLRILKSETKAMKEEGESQPASSAAQAPPEPDVPERTASRIIRSAPGDAASGRPVAENGTEPR
ncbi:Sec-independent protein translocase subunit TatA [Streptomyces sp. NPDC015032]|uniref:Sec-independent protein translocase subunit TatA n=1 Tax=Streptomyces sp. NPDC015032 TaxID=3364937 RepID=UPI0036F73191